MADTYRIVRFYKGDRENRTIKTGITLDEARAWCNHPGSKDDDWFDGYAVEVGEPPTTEDEQTYG